MLEIFKMWYNSLSDGDKYFLGMILWSIITGIIVISLNRNFRTDYILNVSNANYYPSVTDESVRNRDRKIERLLSGREQEATASQMAADEYGF